MARESTRVDSLQIKASSNTNLSKRLDNGASCTPVKIPRATSLCIQRKVSCFGGVKDAQVQEQYILAPPNCGMESSVDSSCCGESMNCRHPNTSSAVKSKNLKLPNQEKEDKLASSQVLSTPKAPKAKGSKFTHSVSFNFKCDERAEKRKEFYSRLEEKHMAMDEEKKLMLERAKKEENAKIRELRRSLIIKANPVPRFYHEGPQPKVELRKIHHTRAKSPKCARRSFSNSLECSGARYGNDGILLLRPPDGSINIGKASCQKLISKSLPEMSGTNPSSIESIEGSVDNPSSLVRIARMKPCGRLESPKRKYSNVSAKPSSSPNNGYAKLTVRHNSSTSSFNGSDDDKEEDGSAIIDMASVSGKTGNIIIEREFGKKPRNAKISIPKMMPLVHDDGPCRVKHSKLIGFQNLLK